jgi:hypothetical protein
VPRLAERIEGNVVWDCNAPTIDYEHGCPNNNQWIDNVLSVVKEEPPQAEALREKPLQPGGRRG